MLFSAFWFSTVSMAGSLNEEMYICMAVYSVPCLNLNYSIIPSELIMFWTTAIFFAWLIIKIPIKNHMPEFWEVIINTESPLFS